MGLKRTTINVVIILTDYSVREVSQFLASFVNARRIFAQLSSRPLCLESELLDPHLMLYCPPLDSSEFSEKAPSHPYLDLESLAI